MRQLTCYANRVFDVSVASDLIERFLRGVLSPPYHGLGVGHFLCCTEQSPSDFTGVTRRTLPDIQVQ